MNDFYRGYIPTKDKRATVAFSDPSTHITLEAAQKLPEYAGVLAEDTVLIDVDDPEQSEILADIIDDKGVLCKGFYTTRGAHFLFKCSSSFTGCKTNVMLACGIWADIKLGRGGKNAYEVLKMDGENRAEIWDDTDAVVYQEVPKWLQPIEKNLNFLNMETGDGRNSALFGYILILQSKGFSKEEARECIEIINKYVLKDPLPADELEVILRDEAFSKDIFFMKGKFQHNVFGNYMISTYNIVSFDGRPFLYCDGIYSGDQDQIGRFMLSKIENLTDNQRKEVFKYLHYKAPIAQRAGINFIAFENGVYDLDTCALRPLSPDIILTEKIPHSFRVDAYCKLTDDVLNKLTDGDSDVRMLLEELIGYCFYRSSEFRKAFILIGDKRNGKSTFLNMLEKVLGEKNICALSLSQLSEKYHTASLFNKLANIGDDIDNLNINNPSLFKKITSGDRIKAEEKYQLPIEFNPYSTLIFSANDLPHINDRTGAVIDRLITIPFRHTFSTNDPDYDPQIKYKLNSKDSMEYLVQLGVKGLHRLIRNRGFTNPKVSEDALKEYEKDNDPILAFVTEKEEEHGGGYLLREPVSNIYMDYKLFCDESSYMHVSKVKFGMELNRRYGLLSVQVKMSGRNVRMYRKCNKE